MMIAIALCVIIVTHVILYKIGFAKGKSKTTEQEVVDNIKAQINELPVVKFSNKNKTEYEQGFICGVQTLDAVLDRVLIKDLL